MDPSISSHQSMLLNLCYHNLKITLALCSKLCHISSVVYDSVTQIIIYACRNFQSFFTVVPYQYRPFALLHYICPRPTYGGHAHPTWVALSFTLDKPLSQSAQLWNQSHPQNKHENRQGSADRVGSELELHTVLFMNNMGKRASSALASSGKEVQSVYYSGLLSTA